MSVASEGNVRLSSQIALLGNALQHWFPHSDSNGSQTQLNFWTVIQLQRYILQKKTNFQSILRKSVQNRGKRRKNRFCPSFSHRCKFFTSARYFSPSPPRRSPPPSSGRILQDFNLWFLTLYLHLVTQTNLRVWSLPRISSLQNSSICGRKEDCVSRIGTHTHTHTHTHARARRGKRKHRWLVYLHNSQHAATRGLTSLNLCISLKILCAMNFLRCVIVVKAEHLKQTHTCQW